MEINIFPMTLAGAEQEQFKQKCRFDKIWARCHRTHLGNIEASFFISNGGGDVLTFLKGHHKLFNNFLN